MKKALLQGWVSGRNMVVVIIISTYMMSYRFTLDSCPRMNIHQNVSIMTPHRNYQNFSQPKTLIISVGVLCNSDGVAHTAVFPKHSTLTAIKASRYFLIIRIFWLRLIRSPCFLPLCGYIWRRSSPKRALISSSLDSTFPTIYKSSMGSGVTSAARLMCSDRQIHLKAWMKSANQGSSRPELASEARSTHSCSNFLN